MDVNFTKKWISNKMKPVNTVIGILIFLLCLQGVYADPCSSGKPECLGAAIFDCSGGQLNLVERCQGTCEDATCHEIALAPDISYAQKEVSEPMSSNDFILYTCIFLAALVTVGLYLRIRTQR
jgi:hypothetical protein